MKKDMTPPQMQKHFTGFAVCPPLTPLKEVVKNPGDDVYISLKETFHQFLWIL